MKKASLLATCLLWNLLHLAAQDFHALNDSAVALYQKGSYREAATVGTKALAQAEKEFGTGHINYAYAAENLASAWFQLEAWQKARQYFHLARSAYTTVAASEAVLEVGLCNNSIGTTWLRDQRYDSAGRYYQLAYQYFLQYPADQYNNLVTVASNYCEALIMQGMDQQILEVARALLPLIDGAEGKWCANYLLFLVQSAAACKNQQLLEQAVQQYGEAVAVASRIYGNSHPEYLSALDQLGDCLRQAQQYRQSEDSLQKALHIIQKTEVPAGFITASVYHHLGNLYGDLSVFDRATRCYDSSIAILETASLQQDIMYSTVLRSKAYTLVDAGSLTQARQILQQVTDMYEKQYGKDYAGLGEVLITLGNIAYQTNALNSALQYVGRGMQIANRVYGPNNYISARALEIQALTTHKQGQSNKALELCEQALQLTRHIFGDTSQFTASTLSNKSIILQEMGDYAGAETALRLSFSIRQQVFGTDHPQSAISMINLANVMIMQSRFTDADKLLAAAYEIYQKRNMLATPNALMTINTIAMLMEKQGDYTSAAQLYSQALARLQSDSTANGMVYGALLNNLSINYLNQNKYEEALRYARETMEFSAKTQGQQSLAWLKASNNALVAYSKLYRLEEGRGLGTTLARLCRQVLGDSAALLGTVYSNLSALEARAGNLPLASQYQEQSLRIQMHSYEQNIYALSERDQVAYWQQQAYQFQLLPSLLLASQQPNAASISTMVNQQLRLKGFVLTNAAALLRQARQLNNPALQQVIDDWQATRTLYLQQSALPVAQRQYTADSLSIRANNLEQAVNSMAGQVIAPARTAISWQQIQEALEPTEAAIEYIRYPKFGKQYYTDSIYYAAIIIRKKGPPSLVPLGSEAAVQWCLTGGRGDSRETSINKLYRSSIKGRINTGPTFTGDSLFRLIWQPMQNLLQGITTVSIAPDGLLHKLAFAALPTGEGALLLDSLELRQYTSIRQIAARSKGAFPIRSAVLEGFARFGRSDSGNEAWAPLPGTEKEIQAIAQLLKENKIPYHAQMSDNASEASLKLLSQKPPTLLHIATHGYFLPDLPQVKDNGATGSAPSAAFQAQNPLVRSGIVLAGANRYWQQSPPVAGQDDGIVSAYEIAQMNLQGTELAVLSACETGLGEVQDSEGVFGLQRALKMAGIRNMILSLWQVPDEETKELMTLFYKELLAGIPTRTAFDRARRGMRARYPPFAWAAFVLIE